MPTKKPYAHRGRPLSKTHKRSISDALKARAARTRQSLDLMAKAEAEGVIVLLDPEPSR